MGDIREKKEEEAEGKDGQATYMCLNILYINTMLIL